MNLQEINELTLEDNFKIVLERVVDFSTVPKGETKYIFATSGDSKYDRLILNSKITKPTIEELEAGLEAYKEDLRLELIEEEMKEAARIAEIERVDALELRFKDITYIREAIREVLGDEVEGSEYNHKKLIKKLIAENSVDIIEQLEAASIIVDEKEAIKEQEKLADKVEKEELKAAKGSIKDWNLVEDIDMDLLKKLLQRLIKELR